jgi:hypothetical protein
MLNRELGRMAGMTRWVRGAARGVIGVAISVGLLAAACSGEDKGCEGFTAADGSCQKKCDVASCADPANMKCVNNACLKSCVAQTDCPLGYYCYGGRADDGVDGQFCDFAPFAKNDGGTGINEPCTTDEECDTVRGYTCVSGECSLVGCTKHDDCAGIGLCQAGTDVGGNPVLACQKGTTYEKGQFGTACPGGTDAKECDEANKFVCIGAGPGDVDAYCTKTGCSADTDCATGYFCSTVRTSRPPCSDNCNLKGNSSATTCVPSADIGAGKEYSCGPVSLLRNLCLKREYCNDCETDDDCRGVDGQVCAKDTKGNKICSVICDPNISNACPWGNASLCAVHDTDLGLPTCAHRFGSCQGTGKNCEPCRDDGECPTGLCLGSDFTGEQYCVDLGPKCDCTGLTVSQNVSCQGGGCPQTPGGLTMNCYGGSAVQAAGSPLYQSCVGANVNPNPQATPQTGCWPAL